MNRKSQRTGNHITIAAETKSVGSGVVVCLWDSVNKIGGANHFMLPEGPEDGESATRYADAANSALLERILTLGADRKNLQAKLFGGSLPGASFGEIGERLGDRNVQAATHFLSLNGIRVVHTEVGGTHGRKLVFQTDDGQAWCEEL